MVGFTRKSMLSTGTSSKICAIESAGEATAASSILEIVTKGATLQGKQMDKYGDHLLGCLKQATSAVIVKDRHNATITF